MTQRSTDKPRTWVVVCDDMHLASGLYLSIVHAVKAAKQLSDSSDCKFRPVPIVLSDNVEYITMPAVPPSPEGIEKMGGGYL